MAHATPNGALTAAEIAADTEVTQSRIIDTTIVTTSEMTLMEKLEGTWVPAGYFVDSLPITPSKRKAGESIQSNRWRMANAPAYMSVKFESNSEGKDFKLCWRDRTGNHVKSDFVKFAPGITRAQAIEKAIVNYDKHNRRANEPTYLSVEFDHESDSKDFNLVWKDGASNKAPARYAKLNEGMTKAQAIESAILNWDKNERLIVDKYNTKLIIALARMRIVRFAKEGTNNFPYIPQDLRVNDCTLQCQLASDEFEEYYGDIKKVHENLKRRKVGAPSHRM
ncbi:hypothetical protein FBEOM_13524 [Fusarium beomiforme]|uniref:Uncharacterized protein n=1 Tax=Fusarium beomiforme TaxID=44412 RepID=A0A9P5A698_9HYPO|nr:hypothetical protein FBEOM_13524 [Fusarium beomiforme]